MRVIVRFPLKIHFSKMKSNFKDISPKRLFRNPNVSFKKRKQQLKHTQILCIFILILIKRSLGASKGNPNMLLTD